MLHLSTQKVVSLLWAFSIPKCNRMNGSPETKVVTLSIALTDNITPFKLGLCLMSEPYILRVTVYYLVFHITCES